MPSIVVLGASEDRAKFGNKCVRAYAKLGYDVYPVNPKAQKIEGLKCYKSIAEVPVTDIDRVSFYLPPPVGLKVIEEVTKKKVGEVWLNPGAESDELIDKAEKLGLNVIAACSIVDVGPMPSST